MLAYLQLLRPHQWIKNIVVFVPALLSGVLSEFLSSALISFFAFCLVSSAAYVVNDIFDASADREHPRKRRRPIASGKVSPLVAWILAGALAIAGLAAAPTVSSAVILGIYLAINIAYSFWLKHIPIVDGVSISLGFVLRLLAGGPAIGLALNPWIFSSFFFVALGMAMVKRRVELVALGKATSARPSLQSMNRSLLDVLVGIFMAAGLTLYAAWAALHPNIAMVFSLPVLSVGFARFMWLAYALGDGEDFSRTLLTDLWIMIAGALWLGSLFLFA